MRGVNIDVKLTGAPELADLQARIAKDGVTPPGSIAGCLAVFLQALGFEGAVMWNEVSGEPPLGGVSPRAALFNHGDLAMLLYDETFISERGSEAALAGCVVTVSLMSSLTQTRTPVTSDYVFARRGTAECMIHVSRLRKL